ncbi:MAG: urea transporter [Candidatus Hydrogenedentota bacterium]
MRRIGTFASHLFRATLESYASLLFASGARCGGAIMAITFINPRLGLGGLIGALAGNAAARGFSYPREMVAGGIYGISPLLTGLAIACFHPAGLAAYPLIIPAALLTMTLSTLLSDRCYKNFRVGSLSLAFAIVATVVSWRVLDRPVFGPPPVTDANWVDVFFSSMGAIIFIPAPLAGLGLFLVILFHSRTLAVLAMGGFALGAGLFMAMGGSHADLIHGMVGLNFILTAMAVGGVFLLSGPYATIHAAGAVMMTSLVALGINKILALLGLPVFSWPFNIATILWIGALNLRTIETRPRSTWGLSGSPENMAAQVDLHSRAAVAEFMPRLPIIGEWTVTQGIEGKPTHRPPWSYAIDFEVMDESGFPFRTSGIVTRGSAGGETGHDQPRDNPGERLESYYSYGAPVLAVADGVVVLAVSGIFDNAPGSSNIKDNFGNQVIIRHAEQIYSVYAHLKYLSVRVKAGDVIRAGQVIAQCGSSGRSPRPHLHFHIQASNIVGSPTLPFVFSQFTIRNPEGNLRFIEAGLPEQFDRIASTSSVRDSRPAPYFSPGAYWRFRVRRGQRETEEAWKMDIDLWGGIRLRSFEARPALDSMRAIPTEHPVAEAVWRIDGRGMTAIEFKGARTSALYAHFRAHSRVPTHISPRFTWSDRPGADHTMPKVLSVLRGVLLPFTTLRGEEIHFSTTVESNLTRIISESGRNRTITEWSETGELARLEYISNGRQDLTAERIEASGEVEVLNRSGTYHPKDDNVPAC